MDYYMGKTVTGGFDAVISRVTDMLKEEGFGILTEINVQETLKKKLDVDFKKYKILGACNPHFAYKAFQAEDKIGAILPCNVVVIEQGDDTIEVAFMDPMEMMDRIENPKLKSIAADVKTVLEKVMNKLD